jgi:hypothetical protein
MYFDLDQTAGEHGNQIQRYNEYLGAGEQTYVDWHNVLGDLRTLVGAEDSASAGPPTFLRAANIRHIVSMTQLPGLPLVFQGRTGLVYEVPGALPRAYLAGETRLAETAEEALQILSAPSFDPSRTAVVDRRLSAPLTGPDRVPGTAAVELYEPDRVVVRTDAETDALLVLADNYYDGWEATIDGARAPVVRANHAFRGVRVPAGQHTVEFSFRPPDVYAGLGITSASVLLALVALTGGWIRDRRRRSDRQAGDPGARPDLVAD